MRIAPCTVKAATKKVSEWHRHLPDIQGGLFAAQCIDLEGTCVGGRLCGHGIDGWRRMGPAVAIEEGSAAIGAEAAMVAEAVGVTYPPSSQDRARRMSDTVEADTKGIYQGQCRKRFNILEQWDGRRWRRVPDVVDRTPYQPSKIHFDVDDFGRD